MNILITLLLTLFISNQAYAQSANELITKGKIIHKEKSSRGHSYTIIYKKEVYFCFVEIEEMACNKPKDRSSDHFN